MNEAPRFRPQSTTKVWEHLYLVHMPLIQPLSEAMVCPKNATAKGINNLSSGSGTRVLLPTCWAANPLLARGVRRTEGKVTGLGLTGIDVDNAFAIALV